MNISQKICDFNRKIESMFGKFRVKTHNNVQTYSDKKAEYFAEISDIQLADEIVYFDDDYDVFCFFICNRIDYENLNGFGSQKYRVREHLKGEFVFITKQEIVNQIIGITKNTMYSKDSYLLSSIISQLLLINDFLTTSAELDTSKIEKRYMRDNVLSVEHKIISFVFEYVSDVDFCINLDCLFDDCEN